MKSHKASQGHGTFLDIGYSSLKVFAAGRGMEWRLERSGTGELTAESRQAITHELRRFLGASRPPPRRGVCALPARGVSLRRLILPPTSPEETQRLLALWVEKEFPLPPAKLAWGYQLHPSDNGTSIPAGGAGQAITVAALRREVLESYAALLEECGLSPAFSLGALAASRSAPRVPGRSALLDIGRMHAELLILEEGQARSVRTFSWGGEEITQRLSRALDVSLSEAEDIKRSWTGEAPAEASGARLAAGGRRPAAGARKDAPAETPPAPLEETLSPDRNAAVSTASRDSIGHLARLLGEAWATDAASRAEANPAGPPARLFLTGGGAKLHGLAEQLTQALGGSVTCERVELESAPGWSSVTAGLAEGEEARGALAAPASLLALVSRPEAAPARTRGRGPSLRLWLGITIVLALVSFSPRYVGLIWKLPDLRSRLASSTELRNSLPRIDSELEFLEAIHGGQPLYLDALAAIAQAAPPGTFLESLAMNRQGEVTLQGTIISRPGAGPGAAAGSEAPNDFRNKLVASGWFAQVVLEEQTPTKEENRVAFRLRAQLRATGMAGRRE